MKLSKRLIVIFSAILPCMDAKISSSTTSSSSVNDALFSSMEKANQMLPAARNFRRRRMIVVETNNNNGGVNNNRLLEKNCDELYEALYADNANLAAANATYSEAYGAAVESVNTDTCEERAKASTLYCDFDELVAGENEFTAACEAIDDTKVISYSIDISCDMKFQGEDVTAILDYPELVDCIPLDCADEVNQEEVEEVFESLWQFIFLSQGFTDVKCTGGEYTGTGGGGGGSSAPKTTTQFSSMTVAAAAAGMGGIVFNALM